MIVSLLSSIGSSKNFPLGYDRESNLYWCFSGSSYLHVCTSVHTKMMKSQESSISAEQSSAFMQPLILPEEHSSKFLHAGRKYIPYSNMINNGDINNDNDNRIWWVYETDVEIGRVIKWLNGRYVCYVFFIFVIYLNYLGKVREKKN